MNKIIKVDYSSRTKPPHFFSEERIVLPPQKISVVSELEVNFTVETWHRHQLAQTFNVKPEAIKKHGYRRIYALGQRLARLGARAWRDETGGKPYEIDPPQGQFLADGSLRIEVTLWGPDNLNTFWSNHNWSNHNEHLFTSTGARLRR